MNPLDILLNKKPHIQLMIEDEQIYEFRGGTKGNKVMGTAEIQFVKKLGYSDNKSDMIKCKFGINSDTCPLWREIFERVLKTESSVKVHGSQIDIETNIEKIENDFNSVKEAIKKTNQIYQKGKAAIFDYAKKQLEERAEKSAKKLRSEEERQYKITNYYEKLKIS